MDSVGTSLADANVYRLLASTYLYSTGLESGYGFFAPNVPDSSKLVFEIYYSDGHVEYELPHVSEAAAGLRLSTLLDYIGDTNYRPLRQLILKMLAYSIWQQHPRANRIRAVYGYVNQPSLREARKGVKESYHVFYACDFTLENEHAAPAP